MTEPTRPAGSEPSLVAPPDSSDATVGAPGSPPGAPSQTPGVEGQLEAVVRAQLGRALGGRRGLVESAAPTLAFTGCWVATRDLRGSLALAAAIGVLLLFARLLQRSSTRYVLNSLVGIGVAAFFALRSGRAEDAFLPGLIYNGAYAVGLVLSVLVRWPLVGLMIGGLTGQPTEWRRDPHLAALCSRLTLVLAAPCVLRVLVQYPLYRMDSVGWLGVTKLALGWPLQIAALLLMGWMLSNRGQAEPTGRPDDAPAAG